MALFHCAVASGSSSSSSSRNASAVGGKRPLARQDFVGLSTLPPNLFLGRFFDSSFGGLYSAETANMAPKSALAKRMAKLQKEGPRGRSLC